MIQYYVDPSHIVEFFQQKEIILIQTFNSTATIKGTDFVPSYQIKFLTDKPIKMKKLIIGTLLLFGMYFFYACNGNTNSDSTGSSNNAISDSTAASKSDTMNNPAMMDGAAKAFIAEAATGGLMEVELGNLAEQKAKSRSVKDFGKMMMDDHTKINSNLKDIVSKKDADLPSEITPDQRKDIDKLSKKSGSDFDKAYVDMMVDDHKKDIDAFKKAMQDVSDNDIKNFITNSLPVLQKHLDAIQAIKSKM